MTTQQQESTKTPEEINAEIEQRFGTTAQEWLDRFDRKEEVWSVRMSDYGTRYEHEMALLMAAFLRHLINTKANIPDTFERSFTFDLLKVAVTDPDVKWMHPAAGMMNAAIYYASVMYKYGPVATFTDDTTASRLIKVKKLNSEEMQALWG
jgi:hypothetical protein